MTSTRVPLESGKTMKKRWLGLVFLLPAITAYAALLPYDDHANASADIAQALEHARAGNKPALLVFGANWCPDCIAADKNIHDRSGPLGDDHYVIVKVDVGNFDKNIDLARLYGNPIRKGIPGVAILTPDHHLQYAGPLSPLLSPYRHWLKTALIGAAAASAMLAIAVHWRRRRLKRGSPAGVPG